MNMMRKNNNRGGGNRNNRGGGQRRYTNNGGGNRSGQNEGQNLQRQKHHATQQLGKYNDLARNAQNNGDRVDVEYYLQHVDHYTRVLADIAVIEAERYAHTRESQIIPGGPNDPNAAASSSAAMQESAAGDAPAGDTVVGNGEGDAAESQRMRRDTRRHTHSQQGEEGSRDSGEIPLPGGILPPI